MSVRFMGFEVNAKTKPLIETGAVKLTTPAELREFINRTELTGRGYNRVWQLSKILEEWERDDPD